MVTLLLTAFAALLCALPYAAYIWFHRRRYTKERFAFAACSAIVTLTLAYLSAATEQLMPWALLIATARWGTSSSTFQIPPPPHPAEQVLLLLALIAAVWTIAQLFHRWDGLRSVQQYRLEQRKEEMVLLVEGLKEAWRVVSRQSPHPIYTPVTHAPVVQFKSSKPAPWRERARDLVHLRWRRYTFAKPEWNEHEGCWVGQDTESNGYVILKCSPSAPDATAVQSLLNFSLRLKARHSNAEVALIVAIEGDCVDTPSHLSEAPLQLVTEKGLLDKLVDWSQYHADIERRMTEECLPDSDLTIQDVFVQPSFESVGGSLPDSGDLEQHLLDWLREKGQRQLSLLGDYGQGKSTAALAITYQLLQSENPPRIPVLVELRGASPRNLTPLKLLATWSSNYGIDPLALWFLHLAGRLVVIFEGFDEMALVGDAQVRLKHFVTLWEFCHEHAKLLITGRPNFFFDEEEMTAALGIRNPTQKTPYCEAMRLRAFDLRQIERALRNHDEKVRREIGQFAADSEQFRELISRPSLLHVVSVLWGRGELSAHVHRLTSADVMKLFINHSYLRQGQKEKDSPDFMKLTVDERKYFMKGVATYMATKQLPNQIDGRQLDEVVVALAEAMPDAVSTGRSAIDGEVRGPLRERIAADAEYGLEHLQTDVRTCGILVNDPATPGAFRFGHKSFMEYLYAEVLGDAMVKESDPSSPAILKACDASAVGVAQLPVSMKFLAEILRGRASEFSDAAEGHGTIARRILQFLYGGSNLGYAFGRLALYDAAVRQVWMSWRPIFRVVLPAPLLVGSAGLSAVVAAGVNVAVLYGDDVLFGGAFVLTATAAIVVSGTAAVAMGMLTRSATRSVDRRLYVWYQLCRDLGTSRQVLYQIAGIWWFPGVRTGIFDLFRDDE